MNVRFLIVEFKSWKEHGTKPRLQWLNSSCENRKSTIQNRKWVGLFAFLLTICGAGGEAQEPKKIPRVGYLSGTGNPKNPGANIRAFQQGLRELGYVEGKNIRVEYRFIDETRHDSTTGLVAELVRLEVDSLVITALPSIRAAKQATQTIPIVMVTTADPVAAGLVKSLASPGGNITGVTRITRELSGKRLELLQEIKPGLARVAVLWNAATGFKAYETAARVQKIQLQSLEVHQPSDLEHAFHEAATRRVGALVTVRNPLVNRHTKRIADLAIENGFPSMHESSEYVNVGGLVSYAASDFENYRRAATYVDRILKGAKPADLPIEQPSKFELVINLKTAKQIALTIPPNVLARADRVIR